MIFAQSSEPRGNMCFTNGTVRAIVRTEDTVYIGGDFTHVRPHTGYGVPIDTSTGKAVSEFPKVNSTIWACVSDGSGGWYIGGEFTEVGGLTRNRIAHILSDFSVDDSWNPNADNSIYCLAVSGSTVYAGGNFTSIGGQSRNRIAALDATTGNAASWNPSANDRVFSLAVSGSTIYAGGNFTSIGGQSRNRIAALDATTGNASSWDPNASSSVRALAVSGSTIYAAGYFTTIGGQSRNRIAALDATTGNATSWNPNASSSVLALAVSGSTIYAGGYFTTIGGQSRNRIAALDATTGNASSWDPNASASVYDLDISFSTVHVAGAFTQFGGNTEVYFALFDFPPTAPSDPGATDIATDSIRWTWTDNADNEEGFKVWADEGALNPTTLRTTTDANATSWTMTGLSPNTDYTFQVAATNYVGDSDRSSSYTAWTLAATPVAPALSNVQNGSIDVTIGSGDGNPAGTQYAIYCETTGQWVQADGSLGAGEIWDTSAGWGAKTVYVSSPDTYTFKVKAKNGAAVETALGPSAGQYVVPVELSVYKVE